MNKKGGENFISWRAPEYIKKDKSRDWYLAVGIIAVAGAVAAFILGNLLFGILILIAAFTLCLYAAKSPKLIKIKVGEKGIKIDKIYYPYANLESFWIEEDNYFEPVLIIKSKKMFVPIISVTVRNIDPEELREYIGEYLEEEEMDEGLSNNILDFFGF